MKNIHKTIAFTGANLIALGANGEVAVPPAVAGFHDASAGQIQNMSEAQLRTLEASHLQVSNMCKWGHAAFDPIVVDSEDLSVEVASIYQQMGVA